MDSNNIHLCQRYNSDYQSHHDIWWEWFLWS